MSLTLPKEKLSVKQILIYIFSGMAFGMIGVILYENQMMEITVRHLSSLSTMFLRPAIYALFTLFISNKSASLKNSIIYSNVFNFFTLYTLQALISKTIFIGLKKFLIITVLIILFTSIISTLYFYSKVDSFVGVICGSLICAFMIGQAFTHFGLSIELIGYSELIMLLLMIKMLYKNMDETILVMIFGIAIFYIMPNLHIMYG